MFYRLSHGSKRLYLYVLIVNGKKKQNDILCDCFIYVGRCNAQYRFNSGSDYYFSSFVRSCSVLTLLRFQVFFSLSAACLLHNFIYRTNKTVGMRNEIVKKN